MKLAFQGLLTFVLAFIVLSLGCGFVYVGFDWVTSQKGAFDRGAILFASLFIAVGSYMFHDDWEQHHD